MSNAIICDTTVWLYLGRIGTIELLQGLYETVYTTESVCFELDVGRSLRADTINPRSLHCAAIVSVTAEQLSILPYNQLGPGEQSVLASVK